jgi:hypothetical protein
VLLNSAAGLSAAFAAVATAPPGELYLIDLTNISSGTAGAVAGTSIANLTGAGATACQESVDVD